MIRQFQVMRAIAAAIEADEGVNEIANLYPNALRIYVGHPADQSLFQAGNCPMVSIAPAADGSPYDAGHAPEDREITIRIRVAVYDDEQDESGRIVTMLGPERAERLAHAIVAAVKAIDGLGDEFPRFDIVMGGGDLWPLCTVEMVAVCSMKRGLAYEPPEVEETDNAL